MNKNVVKMLLIGALLSPVMTTLTAPKKEDKETKDTNTNNTSTKDDKTENTKNDTSKNTKNDTSKEPAKETSDEKDGIVTTVKNVLVSTVKWTAGLPYTATEKAGWWKTDALWKKAGFSITIWGAILSAVGYAYKQYQQKQSENRDTAEIDEVVKQLKAASANSEA